MGERDWHDRIALAATVVSLGIACATFVLTRIENANFAQKSVQQQRELLEAVNAIKGLESSSRDEASTMSRQLDQLKDQVDLTREEHRAWLELSVEFGLPSFEAKPGTTGDWISQIQLNAHNSGHSPAHDISTWTLISPRLTPPLSGQFKNPKLSRDNASQLATAACETAKGFSNTHTFTGFLFPDRDWHYSGNSVGVHDGDLRNATGQLLVSTCVAYRTTSDKLWHFTSQTTLISKKEGKIDINGEQLDVSKLRFDNAAFSPSFAN